MLVLPLNRGMLNMVSDHVYQVKASPSWASSLASE